MGGRSTARLLWKLQQPGDGREGNAVLAPAQRCPNFHQNEHRGVGIASRATEPRSSFYERPIPCRIPDWPTDLRLLTPAYALFPRVPLRGTLPLFGGRPPGE